MKNTLSTILRRKKSRRLFFFLMANFTFMSVEIFWGFWTNSLGLISDGCHMLFDCIALAIGLCAAVISHWDQNNSYSYGYARMQVISGFINALLLVFIAFFVLIESMHRFIEEAEIKAERLLLVSICGFLVNVFGVFSFHDHSESHSCSEHSHSHSGECKQVYEYDKHAAHHDDNIQGIFLHVLADTLGSVGVMVSSVLVEWYGFHMADPICSLCISGLIFASVMPLLFRSSSILLQCTPAFVDAKYEAFIKKVTSLEGVYSCRDLHFWVHGGPTIVSTMTVDAARECNEQFLLSRIKEYCREIGVTDVTIEINKESTPAWTSN
ncbi:zinc transporter 5 [Pelomyxa schiedti]|nr:zinc transporter 5 [Pelomyxa schiedti]